MVRYGILWDGVGWDRRACLPDNPTARTIPQEYLYLYKDVPVGWEPDVRFLGSNGLENGRGKGQTGSSLITVSCLGYRNIEQTHIISI